MVGCTFIWHFVKLNLIKFQVTTNITFSQTNFIYTCHIHSNRVRPQIVVLKLNCLFKKKSDFKACLGGLNDPIFKISSKLTYWHPYWKSIFLLGLSHFEMKHNISLGKFRSKNRSLAFISIDTVLCLSMIKEGFVTMKKMLR